MALFSIFRKGQGKSPPPHPPPPASLPPSLPSLNIPKCLNTLFWLCYSSEYAWWFYMFKKLLKMPRVLNVPGFWIWYGCISKGYTEYWICLSMAQYASKMSEYVWICLNVPKYAWTGWNCWMSMNMPEHVRIDCSAYARVFNISHHLRYMIKLWICLRH